MTTTTPTTTVREAAIANGWDPADGSPWVGPDGVTYESKDAFYATTTALHCPSWCLGQHLEDGQLEGTVHQRRIVVGDVYVTIEESTDVPEGCADPVGATVEVDQYQWVSGESVRWLAEALNRAADLIGIEAGSR